MNLFYVHWNEAEWQNRVKTIHRNGIHVTGAWKSGAHNDLMKQLPDVLVISLDRLPSHGRTLARWFWESKKRQQVPIIFEGGLDEKTIPIRAQFPKAKFVENGKVLEVL